MGKYAIFKWVGGKEWLWKHIKPHLISRSHEIYIEPFLGAGAIAFHYIKWCKKHKISKKFILSDSNAGLINVYVQIRDQIEELLNFLRLYDDWITPTKEIYNFQRKLYNLTPKSNLQSAALFIWLLSHSFRGLYRVNKRGEYNTPFGYPPKNWYDEKLLYRLHDLFQGVDFRICSYDEVPEQGLIYLDPPYVNTFQNYTLNPPTNEEINNFIKRNSESTILISNNENYKPVENSELLLRTTAIWRANSDIKREECLYLCDRSQITES